MLNLLDTVLTELPAYVKKKDIWHTKHIDYHPPRVERVWTDLDDYRISLHRIHPCDNPLKHVHPWPSAVEVLSGRYEMKLGTVVFDEEADYKGQSDWKYDLASTLLMTKGSRYEILSKHTWHSVRPIGDYSISLMVIGKPWKWQHPSTDEQPKPGELSELDDKIRDDILDEVQNIFLFS